MSTATEANNTQANNNQQQNILLETLNGLAIEQQHNQQPAIIYDLRTELNTIKNELSKDIKRYIDKHEETLNKIADEKAYEIYYERNIKLIKKLTINMDEKIKEIIALFNTEPDKNTLLNYLRQKLISLSLLFVKFKTYFRETRQHYRKFANNNDNFKGYNKFNELFKIEVNEDNLNKIQKTINNIYDIDYVYNLKNGSIKEIKNVKNKYIDKLNNKLKLNNMIYNIDKIINHYKLRFIHAFDYKLFIMKLLNLKFYLQRIEDFKQYPEYEQTENNELRQLTLKEMKKNEYKFLKQYQERPAEEETFKDDGLCYSILSELNTFKTMFNEALTIKDDTERLIQMRSLLKMIKGDMKGLLNQLPKTISNSKQGEIINKNGLSYVSDMVKLLDLIYGVDIDKGSYGVYYRYDIDVNDLKEDHDEEEDIDVIFDDELYDDESDDDISDDDEADDEAFNRFINDDDD